jgi:SAM-dependent methyltransferase
MNATPYPQAAVAEDLGAVLLRRLYPRVLNLYQRSFSGLVSDPSYITRMSHDALDLRRSREQLALIERTHGISLTGKRILEVGAGLGLTVAVARLEFGAAAFGIEPGAAEYDGSLQIARDLLAICELPSDAVVSGVGEDLPFEDAAFDVVLSSNVLEHVRDPAAVIRESIRVLRPGGSLHFVVPSYGSWWEGHYGVLWLPHMPRWAARQYVRLLGRDPAFVNTLQFIHYGWLARIVRGHAREVEVLGYGAELWEQRVRTLDFAEYHSLHKVKALLRVLHRAGLVTLLVKLGRALHWETPLVLALRKRR